MKSGANLRCKCMHCITVMRLNTVQHTSCRMLTNLGDGTPFWEHAGLLQYKEIIFTYIMAWFSLCVCVCVCVCECEQVMGKRERETDNNMWIPWGVIRLLRQNFSDNWFWRYSFLPNSLFLLQSFLALSERLRINRKTSIYWLWSETVKSNYNIVNYLQYVWNKTKHSETDTNAHNRLTYIAGMQMPVHELFLC